MVSKTSIWRRNCSVFGRLKLFRVFELPPFKEDIMIAHRRTWFYRLAGQKFAHAITFRIPVTAAKVKDALRKTVGDPLELWGRSAH
jgi:hypothetical protein